MKRWVVIQHCSIVGSASDSPQSEISLRLTGIQTLNAGSSNLRWHDCKNWPRVTLVVGRILNRINQGIAILAGIGISWNHVVLNYLVPYCAENYSVAENELTQRANQ
jgi:hypothetical protein